MKWPIRIGLVLAAVWLVSCQQPVSSSAPPAKGEAGSPGASDSPATYLELVRKGDYAGALAVVEGAAQLSQAEKDGMTGILILDGLVDSTATKKTGLSLADGFERLERAALAGRVQSVSDLRGKFSTGINERGKNVLLGPQPELAACWGGVEQGHGKAADCVAMRKRLGVLVK